MRRTRQPSMFLRYVTDTNQSESHSGQQQLRFTRNYMEAWRTWRGLLLLDWSCKRTRRRRWRRRRRRRRIAESQVCRPLKECVIYLLHHLKTVLFILSIYVSLKRCSCGKGQLLDASINVCVVPSSKSSSSGKRQSCYSLYFGFTVYDGMVNGNANLKAKTSLTLRLNPYLWE